MKRQRAQLDRTESRAGVALALVCASVFCAFVLATGGQARAAEESAAVTVPSEPPLTGRTGAVLVIANADDPASMELAIAYCRARALPPKNLLALPFANHINLRSSQFRERLLLPVQRRLERLSPAPRYLALIRGVPYRTGRVSTTGALFFGSQERQGVPHPYFGSEARFDPTIPWTNRPLLAGTMITGYTVEDTLRLINNGSAHHPRAPFGGIFAFCQGVGPRGVRNSQIDSAAKALRRSGLNPQVVDAPQLRNAARLMAHFGGATRMHVASNHYLSGALAGNLTSYGGKLFEKSGQTSILEFVRHGVAGCYGTVVEPTNILTRWPELSLLVDYAKGATVTDAYLRHLMDPRLGVVVADPLLAPFSDAPEVTIEVPPRLADAEAMPPVKVRATERYSGSSVARVELWLDNRLPVWTHESTVPERTYCELRLSHGGRRLFRRDFRVREATPLVDVLDRFTLRRPELAVGRAGRHGDKLMVALPNPPDETPPPECTVTLQSGGNAQRYAQNLVRTSRLVPAAVFSLGDATPREGDTVILEMGETSLRVTAQDGDSLQAFASRLATTVREYSEKSVQKQNPGDRLVIQLQTVEANTQPVRSTGLSPGTWLTIADTSKSPEQKMAASLRVETTQGSAFGPKNAGPSRRVIRLNGPARAVLEPVWPERVVREEVVVPAWQLHPGPHTLTAVAFGGEGGRTVIETTFQLGRSEDAATLRVVPERVNLGDAVRIESVPPADAPKDARPVLVINGTPVSAASWRDGRCELPCALPLLPPGPNRVEVHWFAPDAPEVPWRSVERTLFVRRPLGAGANFGPKVLTAGPNAAVRIHGPYLHNGVRVTIDAAERTPQRDPTFGKEWLVDLEDVRPGKYTIRLIGDAGTDEPATLPQTLTIQPPPPE